MLSYIRRSGRLLAPVAVMLAAMVLVGTTDWWHINDTSDFAPAVHHHSAHHPILKARASTAPAPGEHCYLCHWLRSFQNGLSGSTTCWLTGVETRQVHLLAISVPHDAAATLLPARAPPV